MLFNTYVSYTSQIWLFKFQLIQIKYNLHFSSSLTLGTFQMLNSHAWLVLDTAGTDYFHHGTKFFWIKQGWPAVNC